MAASPRWRPADDGEPPAAPPSADDAHQAEQVDEPTLSPGRCSPAWRGVSPRRSDGPADDEGARARPRRWSSPRRAQRVAVDSRRIPFLIATSAPSPTAFGRCARGGGCGSAAPRRDRRRVRARVAEPASRWYSRGGARIALLKPGHMGARQRARWTGNSWMDQLEVEDDADSTRPPKPMAPTPMPQMRRWRWKPGAVAAASRNRRRGRRAAPATVDRFMARIDVSERDPSAEAVSETIRTQLYGFEPSSRGILDDAEVRACLCFARSSLS